MKEKKIYGLSGFRVLEYDALGSTNTAVWGLPVEEAVDGTVVATRRQEAGRGQGDNHWESEAGKNLAFSILWRPDAIPAARQFAVSMVVALGCVDFARRYVEGCSIKWPNDIYVGHWKLAGILIEHAVAADRLVKSVCGIGVNINQRVFRSDAPNPVSIAQLIGCEIDIQDAFAQLLECIARRYKGIADYAALERDYLRCLYRRVGVHEWEDGVRGRFRAGVEGVDEYGRLVLRDETGTLAVYGFKEVRYVLPREM